MYMDVHEEYTKATTLTLPEMRRRSNGGVVCSYKKILVIANKEL